VITMVDKNQWLVYRGGGEPHDGVLDLPAPPPWRSFDGEVRDEPPSSEGMALGTRPGVDDRARNYLPSTDVVEMVNAALYLRRPLLVTGKPGTGKSALAYNIAYELKLGPVLNWSITSNSTLRDALYRYDAIGWLQEAHLARGDEPPDTGRYIRLGPVGSALVPTTGLGCC
jgi:hypothetical protein